MSASNSLPPFPVEASGSPSPSPSSPEVRGGRNGHGRKRFRAMAFPRKRAVTACETCRWKKTKCGNERPVCATCAKHGWPCSYDPRLDHASFDPASLLILDKLSQTLQKLAEIDEDVKGVKGRGQNACACTAGNGTSSTVLLTTTTAATDPTRYDPSAGLCDVTTSSSPDCLEVPTAFGSTEAILAWPIFNGRWPPNLLSQELLIGNLPSPHGDRQRRLFKNGGRANHGVNEENVPSLVDRFLQLVHSKNPVFNTRHIREATRQVAEDGFGWDASSCIVLLACALGAVARPFNPSSEAGLLGGRTSLDDDTFDLETGDAYYQVARKRLGLLDQSIMAGQCHMLSGIYLMYTLRPLEGWSAFHQAGSTYSLYLRSQAALQERNNGVDVDVLPLQLERRLEQRLYWTVLKSECEVRVQLDLPQSALCKLDYPFLFPSPPTHASPAETPEDHLHVHVSASIASTPSQVLSLASSGSQSGEEQTWFYYLSEIALRRIENRVLNLFYKEDPQHWVRMDLAIMINAAQEIEAQMETWYASLPTCIRFDGDHYEPSDELRHVTQGRSILIRGLLYRPFLYYAIHASHEVQVSWNLTTTLQEFVQKSLAVCVAFNDGHALTHRHHGTWYVLRESVAASLMLLAARAADLITVDCLQAYTHSLQICVDRLRYWEAEAPPDIVLARGIIEDLVSISMDDNK